ncbi:synaptotagmin-3-like isoform X1 [Nicotiana tomentosiformis]|uniref:synaptotagmin-3-like isoform X1 n=2 Tax=Nicotiana tomentosiformis TaxID=4098 RepID=UPI00051C8F3D|nr:synaptotagmin-3-like isoform X2 [Nicotiana tomentosiformis]
MNQSLLQQELIDVLGVWRGYCNEMGLLSSLLGILGFGIGFLLGVFIGFYFFIYSEPTDVEDPVVSPLCELDTDALQDLIPDIPLWVKSPDYDRVDWLNKFLQNMWPFLDKAICSTIRSVAEPIFAEYIGQYTITKIDFVTLNPGTLPPVLQGLKVYETNERELVMEPAIKWAGNPNIVVVVTSSSLQNLQIKLQLVDLQIFVAPRVTLKPLVPSFPCFANIMVSLMEKPHVDFGLKVLGGDVMAIPGLYRYVQEIIKKQVAVLYHWPQTLEIPVLDASLVGIKKPVGILHVKVVRAMKLLKMDLLGLSDPYVKLSLSGDSLPSRKTSIKKKNLNPEWNESFKLTVKDPQSQILHLDVIDWDKVGAHDRLGSQLLPLKLLIPNETKEFTLDLVKSSSISVAHDKKQRGQIVVELTYAPFREDTDGMSGPLNSFSWKENGLEMISGNDSPRGAGLLFVTVQGAKDVEGSRHNNPYVVIFFRGEKRKSKMVKKTRDPQWCEEFHFMLEDPPVHEKIHLEVLSKRNGISFRSKESLGHVDINLDDVVHNGRINEKYHLIDSKNGVIHVDLRWKSI